MNVDEFNKALKASVKEMTLNEVIKVQRLIGLEALRRIVLKTPVDTGRARGSWQTTFNNPTVDVIDRVDPSGGQAISEGLGVIGSIQDYGTLFISSNLAYIEALENGHSKQAPAGMVALTLEEISHAF